MGSSWSSSNNGSFLKGNSPSTNASSPAVGSTLDQLTPSSSLATSAPHSGALVDASVQTSFRATDALSRLLASNQFAQGGLMVMATGAAVAGVRLVAMRLFEYSKRRFLIRAEIDSRDSAYRWLIHWLSTRTNCSNSTSVSISTSLSSFGLSGAEEAVLHGMKVLYIPAPGDHLVTFRNTWVWVQRKRASGAFPASNSTRLMMETLHLTILGRSRAILEALVEEAGTLYEEASRSRMRVYSVDQTGYWNEAVTRPLRPLKSVVLPKNQAEELMADCREFLASEDWYAHHGIPYRRGYLFYGAPGTGKTSLVTALAGELQLDIYVVTLSSPSMTDEVLRSLMNSASPRSVLLLEDVDAAFVGRTAATPDSNSLLTFSGLLNAIDGVAAQEGRLLFMTTNHVDRLSNALVRPGRVDVRMEFKLAEKLQIRELFVSFFSDMPKALASTSQSHVPTGSKSISLKDDAQDPSTSSHSTRPAGEARPVSDSDRLRVIHDSQRVFRPGTGSCVEGDRSSSRPGSGTCLEGDQTSVLPSTGTSSEDDQTHPSAAPRTSEPHLVAEDYDAGMEVAVKAADAPSQSELTELADAFARVVPEHTVSMAGLQGFLMRYKRDPWGAISNAEQWIAGIKHDAKPRDLESKVEVAS